MHLYSFDYRGPARSAV